MQDELGDRMKEQYENRTRISLPRRTYTIIRLDGKAFHTYTRGLDKPFDKGLYEDMDKAIIAMMCEVQGVKFAYTQSDEISLLLTDFALPTTSAWFDGNLQKMVSVAASIITAEFNMLRVKRSMGSHFHPNLMPNSAYFDGRAFTIPDRIEVMNYFIHRNQDCSRNSVSMVAQSHFSHKQLNGKSTAEMQEMLMKDKDVNWSYYPDELKNGRLIVKEEYMIPSVLPKTETQLVRDESDGIASTPNTFYAPRTRWVSKPAWKFTQDKERLLEMIPKYE